MRTAALVLILAGALATPASAQLRGKIQIVKPEAAPAGLRGVAGGASQDAPRPRGDLSALVPAPPPVRPASSPLPAEGGQCRKTCARDYYFCLSAEDEATCSPIWVKCQARCGG
ncbi:hypothetical protein [Caulobacter mirabilis]|uniref:ShKT domain-containing protein n=1 Tax=Caulobacter mirabilis TaxID=69666 RepID=A0A2D2ASF2_9CAUL|nr:hypothetical protein [Caulobacter mirabilis]ATQ40916.1 hypothetical protein CSW64_00085 [Caulobacter mirabilis]